MGPDTGPDKSGHASVLLTETVELLDVGPGGRYIDCTFGGGGHSREVLRRSSPDGQILAFDADPAAKSRAAIVQSEFPGRLTLVQANFAQLAEVARSKSFVDVDGIMFDLGLSSFQFDEHDRGFSIHSDARLDMRLDPDADGPTAWDIVNTWEADDIANVIFQYGDERRSRKIARFIVDRRPIETNLELASVVEAAVGGRRGARIHPATKTFQAIRIAVNDELGALRTALSDAVELTRPGGRIAVIAFHSLEDRIVKQFFHQEARDCICPASFPVCNCDHKSTLRRVTRGGITPGDEEQQENPRSRSARLRVAERI
ncbi:MAG: 16S rRNA (cytosine(1402)-N(4))-methyltransferase RsmH [Sphaerobacteraceae bacterium]|nr:MAG: 16S rRNA (cytosine(1402)-N(4))-methyltransferase RsmH [Sphaerobacteraceae bacterium]